MKVLTLLTAIYIVAAPVSVDERCPIKIKDMRIGTNDVFTTEIRLTVINMSEKDVANFEIEVSCFNKYGNPVRRYNTGNNNYIFTVKGDVIPAEKNLIYKIEKYDCKKEWVGESWKTKKTVCKEKKIPIDKNERSYTVLLSGFDSTVRVKDFSIKKVIFTDNQSWIRDERSDNKKFSPQGNTDQVKSH